jgi:hypothetical protein
MSTRPRATLPEPFKAALERLIKIAHGDTGQSRKVANFLLAWWNASENGGFDLVELWAVDTEIAQDMISVCRVIAACHCYPDTLGYKKEFEQIWKLWREEAELARQAGGAL